MNIRIGKSAANEKLPHGTTFRAPLALANVGFAPVQAAIQLDWTSEGQSRHNSLGPVTLAPGGVSTVELVTGMGVEDVAVENLGVEISYSGPSGSVIGALTNFDQSGDLSFEVPIKDPLSGMSRTSGSHPWRIDSGLESVLYLKNITSHETFGFAVVKYAGGKYSNIRLKFAPHESLSVNLRTLIAAKAPDPEGNTIPLEVTQGKIIWYEEQANSLMGRIEMTSAASGTASSFSCGGPACSCSPSYFAPGSYLSPGSLGFLPTDPSQTVTVNQTRVDNCTGSSLGTFDITSGTYAFSNNTGAATLSLGATDLGLAG